MPAIKTELELAVRVTLDLSHKTTATEREMLVKALQLAKDVHVLRGTSDPALALIEERLSLEAGAVTTDRPLRVSVGKAAENEMISRMLGEGMSRSQIARRLGLHWRTVRNRMKQMGLEQAWERRA